MRVRDGAVTAARGQNTRTRAVSAANPRASRLKICHGGAAGSPGTIGPSAANGVTDSWASWPGRSRAPLASSLSDERGRASSAASGSSGTPNGADDAALTETALQNF